jgi:hypothetical protein
MLPPTSQLQEDLQVELKRTNRIRQFEFPQHARMQDAKDANRMVLAAEVEFDGRRVTGEECRICFMLACFLPSIHFIYTP